MAKAGTINEIVDIEAVQLQKKAVLDELEIINKAISETNKKAKSVGVGGSDAKQYEQDIVVVQRKKKAVAELTDQEVKLRQAEQNARKEQQLRVKAENDLLGAMDRLNAKTKEAQQRALDIGATYGKTSEQFKKAANEANKLQNQVRDLNQSLGNHRDDVGRYRMVLDKTSEGIKMLKGNFLLWGAALGIVWQGLMKVVEGMSLTDAGALKAEATIAGIKGGFMALADRMGDVLMGNIKLKDTFDGLGDAMFRAGQAADYYTRQLDAINDSNDAFIGQEAKMRNEIAKLLFLSVDQTKTEKERANALKEALSLEQEIVSFKKTQAQKEYDAMVRQVAGRFAINEKVIRFIIENDKDVVESGIKSRDAVAKGWDKLYGKEGLGKQLSESYAKAINLDTEFFETNKRNQSKLTGFLKDKTSGHVDQLKAIESQWLRNTEAFKKYADAGGFGIPSGPGQTEPAGNIDTMTPKSPGQVTTGAEMPTKLAGVSQDDIGSNEAAKWAARLQIASEFTAKLTSLADTFYQNELSHIDEEMAATQLAKEKELEAAGGSKKKQAEINKKYAKIEADQAKEKKKIMHDQAVMQKAMALVNAIVNTAAGVAAQLTAGPAGIALAVVAAALGAIEIATILATNVPAAARGTKSAPGGIMKVGELGVELVKTPSGESYLTPDHTSFMNIPKGSEIIPHDEFMRAAMAATMPQYTATSTQRQNGGDMAGFMMLNDSINRQRWSVNFDKEGMLTISKDQRLFETWVNNNVRL